MAFTPAQTAFLFPGQGSQVVGMSQGLAEAYPIVRETFQTADDILGYGLAQLCFEGPAEELNQTQRTQPAVFVASVATWRALKGLQPDLSAAYVAGHSLGEFSALVAAGALDFEAGLRLVQRRADLMAEAGERSPGRVAAILGLEYEAVQAICDEVQAASGGVVVVANDNCPGQLVISGAIEAVDAALERASAAGARRVMPLAVSVAVHSPLMQSAGEAFAEAVSATSIHEPQIPIIANVSAQALTTAAEVQAELKAQITAAVRWRESVQTMLNGGVDTFVEVGPGDVLVGLVKRIDRAAKRHTLETPEQLAQFTSAD